MKNTQEEVQSLPTVERFRELIESNQSLLASLKSKASNKSRGELELELRAKFPRRTVRHEQQLRHLSDGLLVEHLIEGRPLRPFRGVVQIIRDSLRSRLDVDNTADVASWDEAVCLALKIHSSEDEWEDDEIPFHLFGSPTPQALVQAALWMRERGYLLSIHDGHPVFSEDDRTRMASELERMIREIGPLNVIRQVFHMLSSVRHSSMGRYLDPAHFVQVGDTEFKFPFPSNYVLQLAIKNIDYGGNGHTSESKWQDFCTFAKMFAGLHNVTSYGQYETLFRNAFSVRDYIVDLALSDRFFRPRQLRSSDVPEWIAGLFDWVGDWPQKLNGWTIATAQSISEIILKLAQQTGPTVLNKKDVVAKCLVAKLDPAEIMNFIELLCHPGPPNQELALPYFPKTITFGCRPLIKLDDQRILLVDPAVCGFAFYEAVAAGIRQWDHEVQYAQKHIGFAAERLLHKHLAKHGISAVCGKYMIGKSTYECDCVIETDDRIIFIEQKGKALTEGSQTGGDLDILTDLLGAFFDSISQCYRHEIFIREHGELTLSKPDGSKHKICLNGRFVEKIGASLLDFGRFNDRSVIMQLLKIYPYAIVAPLNGSDPKKVDKFNKKTQIIRDQLDVIIRLTGADKKEDPIMSSWFLSLQQLMLISEDAGSNEGFCNRLWKTRHLTTQSNDWYTESATRDFMQSKAEVK